MEFITLTNIGMIDFCDNAIASLRAVGVTQDIVVGCVDEESFNHYKDVKGVTPFESFYVGCDKNHQDWGTVGFRKVTQNKFPTIKHFLETDIQGVLYFDNDVVFNKNPQPLIDDFEKMPLDVIIQSDAPTTPFCTGFFLMKKNEKVFDLIDKVIIKNNLEQARGQHHFGDQMSFIHTVTNNVGIVSINVLSQQLFPNGDTIMKGHYDRDEYVIAHANYVVGLEKKRNMLKLIGKWSLKDEKPQTV